MTAGEGRNGREGSEPSAAAVEDACRAWLDLNEELIAGIHHTFNNRLGTLSAILQVMTSEVPPDHPLHGAFAEELAKLSGAVDLLRHLRETADYTVSPLLVAEVLASVVSLYEQHHEVRDVPCRIGETKDLPPLLASPAPLQRLLLSLLVEAGRAVQVAGGGSVDVEFGGDAQRLEVVLRPRPRQGAVHVDRRSGDPIREWVAALDGELTVRESGSGDSLVLSLPTLVEVRRRQRKA